MAVKRWLSTADGDWATPANWSPAVIPAGVDDVYFDEGSVDVDGDLDQSALTVVSLNFTEGYTGDVGSSGGSLLINATNLYDRGAAGSHYLDGTFTTATINNSSTETDAVVLDGSITTLNLFKGNVTIETTATATTIHCGYAGNQIGDVALTIEVAVVITTIYQHGGTITSASNWTNLYLVSGTFTHTDESPTNVYVFDGTFNYEATGETITAVTMKGGRFDANTGEQYQALTITDLTMWPGSVVDLRNQSNTLVVTNPLTKYGGRLLVDEGITIALA